MTIFGRKFEIERLSDVVLNENRWLCDLLHHWHPSGDPIGRDTDQEGKEHLRLAIRNGYLNFYRAGQSVAKVGFDDGWKLNGVAEKEKRKTRSARKIACAPGETS